MREVLKRLLALEEVDRRLLALEARAAAIPKELEGHERAVARAQAALADAEARARDLKKVIDQKNLELEALEERIRKCEADLNQLKTNEAYRSMLVQIGGLKADKSRLEDTILELSYRLDEFEEEIRRAREGVAAAEREKAARAAELEERARALAEERAALQAERERRREGIPPDALGLYERVLRRWGDRALAAAVDQHCQGCQMTLTLQEVAQLTQCDRLLTCRTCSRILYLEEALAET